MDGPAFPMDPAGLSCLGDPGSASCLEPGTRQPGHFPSVLAGRWEVLHQVPGSPQALTTTWPQNLLTVLFCPPKCSVTKILLRFLMWVKCGASDDSFSRKVHAGSHPRVSPCPATRDPGLRPVLPGGAALGDFEPGQVLATWWVQTSASPVSTDYV